MSKKTDAITYTILAFAALIIMVYNFIEEKIIKIYNFIVENYLLIICWVVLYYLIKYFIKKYGWLGFLPDYLVKSQKEVAASNKLEELRDVSNSLDVNYVYLMFDSSLELYKIGYSKDAKYRERTLQGQRPTIELISKKEYPSKTKARQIESLLHKKYASKRTRGEWFKLEKKDIDYLKGYLI